MNNVSLIGRLGRDPELKYTSGGKAITKFTLAVDAGKDHDGQPKTDWIDCTAFDKTAEIVATYARKGDRIGVSGSLHTRSYETQDGQRRKAYEVAAQRVDLLAPKREEGPAGEGDDEEEVPF